MKQKTEAQRGHTADQDCNLAHLTANDSSIAVPQVRKGTGREVLALHWALYLHLRALSFKTFPVVLNLPPNSDPAGAEWEKNQSGRKTCVSQEPSAEDSREHHIIIMANSY